MPLQGPPPPKLRRILPTVSSICFDVIVIILELHCSTVSSIVHDYKNLITVVFQLFQESIVVPETLPYYTRTIGDQLRKKMSWQEFNITWETLVELLSDTKDQLKTT